jgi:hypothetical protein
MTNLRRIACAIAVLVLLAAAAMAAPDALEKNFLHPPDSAKPHTWWHWMNGNITREGITADLEAMKQIGLGGAQIFNVDCGIPSGPVKVMSPEWVDLMKHAVSEANRLGLELCMHNCAGWSSSGGPWITPEFAMQELTTASLTLDGPQHFAGQLPRPNAKSDFYRDIRLVAYPSAAAPSENAILRPEQLVDLTAKMDPEGKLAWDVPAGRWTLLRIGCTTTGRTNHPSPKSGEGLECDKFSTEAMRLHFDHLIGPLAKACGADTGKVFTMTHIDSWEVGTQDWSPRLREEFAARRGYDLTPWLVTLSGGPGLSSPEQTERFRWDFHRTQAELCDEAYAGALRELANKRGLKLSIEGYGPTGDFLNPLTYGTQADLPMSEFWVGRWGAFHLLSSRLIASAAHASGKPIVGAESFTSTANNDAFTEYPYSIKTTGDWDSARG